MQNFAEEQNSKLRNNFERMGMQLKEKDKRIGELLRYEHGAKKTLEEKQQYAQQIEKNLKTTQKCLDSIQQEKNQLLQDALTARETIERLVIKNEECKLQYKELKESFAFEAEDKSELQIELKALYKQFEILKKHVEHHKEKFHGQVQMTDQVQGALLKAEQKNENLKREFLRCKEEIGCIKQHLSKGMRDAKELENRFCEGIAEKVDILKAMQQLQREFDKQHQELISTKEKFKADAEQAKSTRFEQDQQLSASNQRCDLLKFQLNALQEEQRELLEKFDLSILSSSLIENENGALRAEKGHLEKQIEEINLQFKQVSQRLEKTIQEKSTFEIQHEQLLEEISLQRVLHEEKDFQLEEARQHFAKKMREVAQMNDAIEELVRQEGEKEIIQKHLEETNTLLECEVQTGVEEKKELSEKIAALENEIKRWEKDWLLENTQRKLAEEKNVELRKIEQCHVQLQNLLSGFGSTLGSSTEESKYLQEKNRLQTPAPLQFGVLPPQENSNEYEEIARPYSNLFDLPQMQMRSKKNLFE